MRILLIMVLLFFCQLVSGATDECQGTVTSDQIPCFVVLPVTSKVTQPCSGIVVSFYNESTFLYSTQMDDYAPFSCSAVFDRSSPSTYSHNYSTGDSGSVIVTPGSNIVLALGIVLFFITVILVLTIFKPDQTMSSLAGFGFMIVGLFILINGIGTIQNFFTGFFASALLGGGFYIIYKVNIEEGL